MVHGLKRLPARFYRSDSGREPVREWLKSLDLADRKVIGEDHQGCRVFLAHRYALVRSFGNALWEVRSSLPHGRIARVLFCVVGEQMVLLHAFIRRTQKTPKHDLDLALKRMKGDLR